MADTESKIVTSFIQPISFKDRKSAEDVAAAVGSALDKDGNVIDQTAELAAAEQTKP